MADDSRSLPLGGTTWPTETFRSAALMSFVRVRWFIHLRWLAVVGGFVLLSLEAWFHQNGATHARALWVVGVLGVINIGWMAWSRNLHVEHVGERIDEPSLFKQVTLFANAQIAVDLLLLTIILGLYGGVTNPMAAFYVFHMVIASILLAPRHALWQGFWAVFLYGVMIGGTYLKVWPAPAPLFRSPIMQDLHFDGEFVLKTFAVMCISVFVTRHLTSQVAAALDARERELRIRDRALEESRLWIDELHARRARFMRTAAHQLKSPLTGIQTLISLLTDGEVNGDGAANVAQRVSRRCREAIAQVEELLTLARIRDAPSERHHIARTSVRDTLAKVIERLRDLAGAKGQSLVCIPKGSETDIERLLVRVDARDLEDCLGNLVDNALKYTPEGGDIAIEYGPENGWAVVRVRDSGPGIDPDMQQAVFDEFRRGNLALAAKTPGTGLGLSIVREIVEQADGYVSVKSPVAVGSNDNPGTEFEVRLPVCGAPRESEDSLQAEQLGHA